MATSKLKSATVELLDLLYQNVSMGSDSIMALLPKIDNEQSKFKSDLTLTLNGYESFCSRINVQRHEADEESLEDTLMNKMSAKVKSSMGTLMDSSVSHIADIVIEGSTMGMNECIKLIREFENTTASEGSLALARDIVKFEEENIERMKAYL